MRLYEPSRRTIHNDSTLMGDEILRVVTPPQQWAYAATFPAAGPRSDSSFATRIKVRVSKGVLGVGILSHDETRFVKEVGLTGPSEWSEITLVTGTGGDFGPLVIRNQARNGMRSEAEIEILGSVPVDRDDGIDALPEISIDPGIFKRFTPWSGEVAAGFWCDWTGTRTRADVWAFSPEHAAIFSRTRFESTALPLHGEHVLDWVPLVQALLWTEGTFKMAALGAGWGRWLVGGAALARQLGRDFKLLGVEAEPQHFEWMVRHMRDNNIGAGQATLLHAAAAGKPGDCWFATGNSQAWYGQSIVATDAGDGQSATDGLLRVKGVTLKDLVEQLSPIDYLHMDIQGTEADFLRYAPDVLDANVRAVNIGTHGLDIEANLRALFKGLGWKPVFDIELGSTHKVRVGNDVALSTEFGDGVQVWVNPRFAR